MESTSKAQLPPVAKSFFYFCKKCGGDRWHRVLAHTKADTAKLECEVCGSVKSYKLPSEKVAKSPNAKPAFGRAPRPSLKAAYATEYANMIQNSQAPETNYSIKTKFEVLQKINHPKFGLGIVKSVVSDRIEVFFADEVKQLVHNRA